MIIEIVLSLLPYCTPQADEKVLKKCVSYMLVCTNEDSEENCIENLPIELSPE